MTRPSWSPLAMGSAIIVAICVVVTGCASAAPTQPSSQTGGVATFALPVGSVPNYIFPFTPGSIGNNVDLFQFQALMFRPLYWYGKKGTTAINYNQSVAEPPSFSNGGKTVTITLSKKFRWSDGQPITNKDVELWMDILEAEKVNYLGYFAGSIPDNLTSMNFPANSPYQFTLTFNKAYSSQWILNNELSQIYPLPQQAWDRTSSAGPDGNFASTTAGAKAVYAFLNKQSGNESTYATNPLWKTVDGPWTLQSFSAATGAAVFVPNTHYTGPDRPKLSKFEEVPFTSTAAEFDALRSGDLSYGYLPPEYTSQKSYFVSRGYTISSWPDSGFNNLYLNFTNPTAGPIFNQLYIRQAMQELINQPQIVNDIYHGAAIPTYGPIPTEPRSVYTTKAITTNPYPYSVTGAKELLRSHGWSVTPKGVDSCTNPGSGVGQCGPGIPANAKLDFTYLVATGSAPFLAEAESMVSSWSLAGISVSIDEEPEGQLFSSLVPCTSGSSCGWEMGNFGEIGSTPTYSPEYLPLPTQWFYTGGGTNFGGYSSSQMDSLINEAELSPSPAAISAVGAYAAKELPVLWVPNYPYQVSVISPKLKGTLPQDPNLNLYPQKWSLAS